MRRYQCYVFRLHIGCSLQLFHYLIPWGYVINSILTDSNYEFSLISIVISILVKLDLRYLVYVSSPTDEMGRCSD